MIRCGIAIPQGWTGDYGSLRQFVSKTEELGFDSIWLYDHLLPVLWVSEPEKKIFLESWTLISALATETKTVKLGQLVTCNSYRNPALLAKMASTVDVISNGRLVLGLGAGWYEKEYIAYGYPYLKASARISMLDESVQIIRSMWTNESVSFQGKYYSIKELIPYPRPLQKPHPPILIGGSGEKHLLKVVAKYANMSNFSILDSPEAFRRKLKALKEHCDKVGRRFQEIEKTFLARLSLGKDECDLERALDKMKRQDESFEEFKRRLMLNAIGTPEQVTQALEPYIREGATYFIMHLADLDVAEPLKALGLAKQVMSKMVSMG